MAVPITTFAAVRRCHIPLPSNNAPIFTEGDSTHRSVAENTGSSSTIGTPVSATDADNDTLTYQLGGLDGASFSINPNSGHLLTSSVLDFEVQSSYSVYLLVSDGAGGTDRINVTIFVIDVDETPDPVPLAQVAAPTAEPTPAPPPTEVPTPEPTPTATPQPTPTAVPTLRPSLRWCRRRPRLLLPRLCRPRLLCRRPRPSRRRRPRRPRLLLPRLCRPRLLCRRPRPSRRRRPRRPRLLLPRLCRPLASIRGSNTSRGWRLPRSSFSEMQPSLVSGRLL